MKKLLSFLILTIVLIGCSPKGKLSLTEVSLLGTTWKYSDKDKSYKVEFGKKGKLKSTHPNDITPDNDFWKQSGNRLHFELNDGYAKYDGKIESSNLIKGTAKNSAKKSWKWTMKRIK